MSPRRLLVPSLTLALALAPLACGSEDPARDAQRSAAQAAEELAEARSEVEALRQRVAEGKAASEAAEADKQAADEALEKAVSAYDQARNALRDAEQKLASLAPPPPSDEEVFRRVQKQLLDAPALARVAIKAEVSERAVTLHGSVPDEATRDAAISVAGAVDGVASVESELRVGP
jgi:hypothetical protein